MEGDAVMSQNQEFEFRLRLEKEKEAEDKGVFQFQTKSGFLTGMTDPAAGAAQLAEKALPTRMKQYMPKERARIVDGRIVGSGEQQTVLDAAIKSQERKYQSRRKAEGEDGFDWARIAGNIASPASVAAISAPMRASTLGKMTQGATEGTALGVSQPVYADDYWTTKAVQGGVGMTGGAAIPAIGGMVRGGRMARRPFSKKGIKDDVSAFIKEQAGTDKDKIIYAMGQAKEIVPGNRPTVGQALAQANREAKRMGEPVSYGDHIVRLEKDLQKAAQSGDVVKTNMARQALRREQALGVGDDALITAEKAKVKAMSKSNYDKAWKQSISGDQELMGIIDNPYVSDALKTATKLSKAKGINPKENLTEFLQQVKFGLDKQLKKSGDDALDAAEKRVVNDAKTKLVKWMGKKNPLYDEARQAHAKGMTPINRMQISKELREALINSAGDESGIKFATAVRNAPRTIKKATGETIYDTLEKAQGKQQAGMTNKVVDEIMNQAKYNKMASSSEAVLNKMGGESRFSLPHILSRPVVIANAVLRRIGTDKSGEYKRVLGEIMNDPDEFARILKSPEGDPKRAIAEDILGKVLISSGVQPAARGAQ